MTTVPDLVDIFSKAPTAELLKVRNSATASGDLATATAAHAAIQRRDNTQTVEAEFSGRLVEHIAQPSRENAGRYITTFTGDPKVWMKDFNRPGERVKFNRHPGQRVENVKLMPDERVQIVKADRPSATSEMPE